MHLFDLETLKQKIASMPKPELPKLTKKHGVIAVLGLLSAGASAAIVFAAKKLSSGPAKTVKMEIITVRRSEPAISELLNATIEVSSRKQDLIRALISQHGWNCEKDFGTLEIRLGSDGELEMRKPGDSDFRIWPSFKALKLSIPSQPGTFVQIRYHDI
ncbi:MAG: hypothetical protein LBT59_19445 [Clostridiales bacterium]|jgi:hypothetical protein|nr:hypothetical protein [Clostridiales bacterium]